MIIFSIKIGNYFAHFCTHWRLLSNFIDNILFFLSSSVSHFWQLWQNPTDWLTNRFTSLSSGGCKSKIKVLPIQLLVNFCLAKGNLLVAFLHDREKKIWCASFFLKLQCNPILKSPLSWLHLNTVIFQRPFLLIPWY
jgi:hypothetical protein